MARSVRKVVGVLVLMYTRFVIAGAAADGAAADGAAADGAGRRITADTDPIGKGMCFEGDARRCGAMDAFTGFAMARSVRKAVGVLVLMYTRFVIAGAAAGRIITANCANTVAKTVSL